MAQMLTSGKSTTTTAAAAAAPSSSRSPAPSSIASLWAQEQLDVSVPHVVLIVLHSRLGLLVGLEINVGKTSRPPVAHLDVDVNYLAAMEELQEQKQKSYISVQYF